MPPSSERTREPPAISNVPRAISCRRIGFPSVPQQSLHQKKGASRRMDVCGKACSHGNVPAACLSLWDSSLLGPGSRDGLRHPENAAQATAISPEGPDPCNERLLMHVLRSELAVHRQAPQWLDRSGEWLDRSGEGSIGVASGSIGVASGSIGVASGSIGVAEWRENTGGAVAVAIFDFLATRHSPLATRHSPLATVRTMPFRSHPAPALLPRY